MELQFGYVTSISFVGFGQTFAQSYYLDLFI
jgi:hypothetical protein